MKNSLRYTSVRTAGMQRKYDYRTTNSLKYKKARNKANKTARSRKKLYHENKFQSSVGNKQTWGTIKQLLYNGNNKKQNEIQMNTMPNKKNIATNLNKFIASIGEKLSARIKRNAYHYIP